MEITYFNLMKRANESALGYMPAMPAQNTVEAWQAYADEIEALDISDAAHTEADSWDWVIYNGQALQLCCAVPSSVLDQAEDMARDCSDISYLFNHSGLYGIASTCAYWIVYEAVSVQLNEVCQELLDLAYSQIENLEAAL